MFFPFLFAAFIRAVDSSPLNHALDSTPLIIFVRSVTENCITTANTRTLYEILRSCAATTFACTWISMHKNVPGPGKSGGRVLFERALLLDYAVVAPECVTVWAYRQRIAAARHTEEYNRKFGLKPGSQSLFQSLQHWLFCPQDGGSSMPRPWTLTHGFLLEMGGLVILRDNKTPEVIRHVSQLSRPLDIPLDQISDKSKRDYLAKLLVICQTTYFLLQCIARWAARLDVTEIETLTFAFAFLNVLTYALWWNKPQDINVPIEIDLRSPSSRTFRVQATEKQCECLTENPPESGRDKYESITASPNSRFSSSPRRIRWTTIPKTTLRTFQLWFVYPFYAMCESKTGYEDTFTGQLVYASAEGLSEAASPKYWIPLGLITVVFGGLHFIPVWLSYFPTSSERYIWLGCAVWLTVHPLMVVSEKLLSMFSWGPKYIVDGRRKAFPPSVKYGFPVYGGARICILLLALLALRDLPCKSYEDIQWSTFIPHI